MKSILCSKTLLFKSRYRTLKCYIDPNFTYCSEIWTISKAMESQIWVIMMWCLKHMQRISWRAKISNENVLRHIGHDKNLLKWIKTRQMRFLCHDIRKKKLEHLSLTGLMPGKRAWVDNGKHIYNSLLKVQTVLSMMHMTKKHGKR